MLKKSMGSDHHKAPRLLTNQPLKTGTDVALEQKQTHHLKNVLRKKEGDSVRLFNGKDGEWACTITRIDKKSCIVQCDTHIRQQPPPSLETHLFFAPIKKARMDWMIEKSVELGVTHLHPVITHNTEIRDINHERMTAQIIEATEQCERLTIPQLESPVKLDSLLATCPLAVPLLACVERSERALPITGCMDPQKTYAVLIGPEGGFTEDEKEKIYGCNHIQSVSLGNNILRAETAAIFALSLRQNSLF